MCSQVEICPGEGNLTILLLFNVNCSTVVLNHNHESNTMLVPRVSFDLGPYGFIDYENGSPQIFSSCQRKFVRVLSVFSHFVFLKSFSVKNIIIY